MGMAVEPIIGHRLTVVSFPGDYRAGVQTMVLCACDCGWHQDRATNAVEALRTYAAHLPEHQEEP